jgi:hypothetical protein
MLPRLGFPFFHAETDFYTHLGSFNKNSTSSGLLGILGIV